MSMTGNLKQVSPRFLEALKADPSLILAAIDFGNKSIDTEAGSFPIPGHLKKMVDEMPDEQRAQFYAGLAEQWKQMMADPRVSFVMKSGKERSAKGDLSLRNAGFTSDDTVRGINIDKAWHGLHYLLCGQVEADSSPLGSAILGGQEIGEDLGYGPARHLSPKEVGTVASALATLTDEELRSRYNADRMNELELYAGGWDDEQNIDWLLDAAKEVQRYYNEAAQRGFGMLLYIT